MWGQEVVVCDRANHRVQVFGLDGTFVRQWGNRGAGPGQFDRPRGVAVVRGEVFVSDAMSHRVHSGVRVPRWEIFAAVAMGWAWSWARAVQLSK